VDKTGLAGRVKPRILERFSEFWQCRGCGKVYWKGSHHQHMTRLVDYLIDSERPFHG
jgi:uncharacterized protein with PIN domain